MERLLNVAAIMDRYGCSRQTAIRYMKQMEHQTKPYMVTEKAVTEWDRSRTVRPPEVVRREMAAERLKRRANA